MLVAGSAAASRMALRWAVVFRSRWAGRESSPFVNGGEAWEESGVELHTKALSIDTVATI